MRKHYALLTTAAWLLTGAFSVASAQQVSLTIRDGRVTLKAENASVRQILEEWARVGQAKIVNAEKLTGPPQTLTLIDVPEREALDTVLRSAAGYAVVERDNAQADASVFDKILVMARTTPVTQAAAGSTTPSPLTYNPSAPDVVADEPAMADNEPPQPTAPVVNPYVNGAGMNARTTSGMNSGAAGAPGVSAQPSETKFDYTNPQAYFDQQRRAQQAQGGTTEQYVNPYPGSAASPVMINQGAGAAQPNQPTGVPTAGATTSSMPGLAPTPTTPPPGQGGNFNPYNMNPYNVPPTVNPGSTPPTTPVEPDRSKYANPYVPTKPPQP